jgi:hypothetical protein
MKNVLLITFTALAFSLISVCSFAGDWLVTPEEAKKEALIQADGVLYRGRSASVPNCPQINLVKHHSS